ncbi:MAG: Bug family tripartite tricarboxylate transporter substrate binding protein [Pollutimonas bauzanensis]|uniref:Tripartite-type tricarboxylate transporter, receptor component TctC n=1 Tax=Pollutimonas bauzanensis TaxID=658167 RepID=A0A1M5X7A5_9BURK|nr:tripartite tricarboxylate transporter substrate binding protein [Pollutimonas bauzanensis]SHH95715.1 Tripartite-type tricarboxylate transporter, receptor component TctC [Pollutimonas bauzanensis]
MKLLKKITAGVMVLGALSSVQALAADAYPSKPIRLIVGFAPGGATDVLARSLANRLSAKFPKGIIVENRVGAGGLIGANAVAKANPDGYTLAFASTGAFSIAPYIQKTLPYDAIKDFTPVGLIAQNTHVLVVNPDVPAKTVKELVDYAKSNPGKLSYGSFGNGSTSHLLAEQFKTAAGVDAVHIPYAGSPAMVTSTMAGDTAFAVDTLQSSLPYIRSGKLRALAVISESRSPVASDIPTFKEGGIDGIDLKNWYGVVAPAGTPESVVTMLSQDIAEVVADPDFRAFLAQQGSEPAAASGEEFSKFLAAQSKRWGELVKASGAQID